MKKELLILELIATMATLTALYLLTIGEIFTGCYIGILGNVLWIIWGLKIASWPFFVLQCSMILINLNGII